MLNKIIKSEITHNRNSFTAFILSFFFTGLGQIYNGDLLKGFVLFILRILPLLLIPLLIFFEDINLYINIIVFIMVFHIFIWLGAPIEGLLYARKIKKISLNRYNSVIFYSIYGVFNFFILVFSIQLVLLFYSIEKVGTDCMNPTLWEDEYILINRSENVEYTMGDVVTYIVRGEHRVGRIMARSNELVSFSGCVCIINETPLLISIFSDTELNLMGVENSEYLFSEINETRKYPIIGISSRSKRVKKDRPIFVKENNFFIAFDNRMKETFYEIININSITGRVEGIIYSNKLKRIFRKSYL